MNPITRLHSRASSEFRIVEGALLKLEYCRWVLWDKAIKKYGQEKAMVPVMDGLARAETFIMDAREDNAFHSDPVWEGADCYRDAMEASKYARDALRAYKRAIRWCSRRRVREAAKYFQD